MKNKQRTKQEFLDALAAILEEEGHEGIGVNKVAKRAIHSKELLYRYFGNLDGLMTELFNERDYWMNVLSSVRMERLRGKENAHHLKEVIVAILQNQFLDFYDEPVLRELISHSISREPADIKRKFSDARELHGERLLGLADERFEGTDVPFRAIAALLVTGIDGLAIHARNNRGTVNGLDINNPAVQEDVLKTIQQVVYAAFK